ncbi:4'-phosphopantetheinyl transferase family protein [Flavobacterium sp. T12S277]|uniref:4'-phosphopantetheinyl transferase family protein n=1 Tax=Flavobacterium sp. T12S277 TaxID=3402752 RepID=UPI003AE57715
MKTSMHNFIIAKHIIIDSNTEIYLINIKDNNVGYIDKSIIPASQIEEISEYKFKIDSDKRLLARVFLFEYLKIKYNIKNFELDINEYNKPFLKVAPSINFSFSYSKNYMLIGISKEKKIGVDIEYINPKFNINEIAQEIMCKSELDWFNYFKDTSLKRIYFFQLFSAKESIIKAFGIGLFYNVKKINTLDKRIYKFKNTQFEYKELGLWMNEYSLSLSIEIANDK